ncbi:DUF1707 domain-containing protein [Thermopolyspora sp. NPDC052614]|uniref:DUF1707 SHOCT-like domain-containing protein n=1 Tax=Thermopolyspora sp. NPDC052614 TaxID=3155682 RepID=UPI0034379203
MTTPEMRASDGDRDRVAEALREHMAQGRLTVEEFNERLELLYTSKTYGELARLTADLPDTDLHNLPARSAQPAKTPAVTKKTDLRAHWAAWATVVTINWMVYFAVTLSSDGSVYPWPIWVTGPWGIILLLNTIFRDRGEKR